MKYDLIYTDPAWSYDNVSVQGNANDQYDTMSLEDIKNLPVNDLLKENGVVYMWITFPFLNKIDEICKAWKLKYITVGFNWIKLNDNGTPFFGIGFHTKSNGEICIILKKGKGLKVLNNTISQIIMNKKDTHSKKPHEVYTKLELMYGDVKRLEMFARHKRQGWDTWGNEVLKETQIIFKKELD